MSDNKSILVGYIRKSKAGGALKLSIDVAAFKKAATFQTKDGTKYVQLIVNADRAAQILSGEREVTSVSHMLNNE